MAHREHEEGEETVELISLKHKDEGEFTAVLRTFSGGATTWYEKLLVPTGWTIYQVGALYTSFAVAYMVTLIMAMWMAKKGLECLRDQGKECADDHYLCSWLLIMGTTQLCLLQPCLSIFFCCLYVFCLCWAGIGVYHLLRIKANNEACSSGVLKLVEYAVVYSYANLLLLLTIVGIVTYASFLRVRKQRDEKAAAANSGCPGEDI